MSLEQIFPEILIHRIGWWLIHFTWQGTVIAVITSMILFVLQKAGARLRYVISCLALLLIVLCPAITVVLENPLPFPSVGKAQIQENGRIDIQEFRTDDVITSRQFRKEAIVVPFWTTTTSFFENHFPLITLIWIGGVFLFSFYRLFGFFQLYLTIRAIKEPIDSLWENRIRVWIQRLNIRQRIRILQSDRISTPAVCGWLKPVLLIPVSFFTGMDSKSVESIIIHELAHIRRYDYLVNMIQVMIEILGFFHPAIWWLSNRIRKERENCCDDWAVRILGDRLIYVKSLVRLEETRRCPRPVMAANGSELSQRVMRILNYQSTRQSSASVYAFVLSLSLIGILLFTGFRFTEGQVVVQTENLKNRLVAYYPFNGDAKDVSGSGQHGVVKGAVLATDRFNRKDQAYSFNGKDALIYVEGGGRLFLKGSVTVSCWINPQKMDSYASWVSMSYLGSKRSQWRSGFGSNKNSEWGFTETVAEEGQKVWSDYLITQSEIPLDRWTHVTTVANLETGEIIMYKNGRKAGSIDQLKPYGQYKTFLFIGYQPDNPAAFNGRIDEVRVYDTALNEDEVYSIYKMN